MVSSGHWKGKLARVCRCRIVWRRPGYQRWDEKPLTDEWWTEEDTIAARGEATDHVKGAHCPEPFDQVWRSEEKHGVVRACWIKSVGF